MPDDPPPRERPPLASGPSEPPSPPYEPRQPPREAAPPAHPGRVARLIRRLEENDPNPRLTRGMRQVMTIGPFAGLGGILGLAGLAWGLGSAAFLASMVLGSFVGGGKFVIFGTEMTNLLTRSLMDATYESVDFSPWALAGLVVYGDLATCSVLMANMTLLYRTPWLGRRLASAHEAGWYVLHVHRWMHRVAWLGVAIFVAAPFQGSGAVIGTIIARILGLSRVETLTAMLAGSGAGCSALALLGDFGRQQAQALASHPVISLAILAGIVILLMLLGHWFMGHASEAREQFRAAHPPQSKSPTENE